jgi:predicted ATPase
MSAIHQCRGEESLAREQTDALVTLTSAQGFAFYWAVGIIQSGWALAALGRGEEGVAKIRQGLTTVSETGAAARPYALPLLADAYGRAGQAKEGLAVLAEAMELVEKNEMRTFEAELYRLKGTLTIQSQASSKGSQAEAEAEASFLKAIEIAQRQQARSLELRATTSLAHLLMKQGRRDVARSMLTEIYGWFTEGFDTADLKEAKALLDELNR